MWTESNKLDEKTWRTWKTATSCTAANQWSIGPSGFPYCPLTMCKIGKLSFVAGAEIPRKYLG
jgi:hypothetical protein